MTIHDKENKKNVQKEDKQIQCQENIPQYQYEVYKELLSLEIPLTMLVGEIQFYHKRINLSAKKKKKYPAKIKQEVEHILNSITFSIQILNEIKDNLLKLFPDVDVEIEDNEKKNIMDSSLQQLI